MNKIEKLYNELFEKYGPQGWWPLLDLHVSNKGINPTKTGSIKGYHPKNYSYPKNNLQKFEICLGAILTQNTSWPNVEKALLNLKKINSINPIKILNIDENLIKDAIRPAGYFNQKNKKLKIFSDFYKKKKGKIPSRDELLNLWGIGPETADSILLYAYKIPEFIVDSYTKRILQNMKLIDENSLNEKSNYDIIKNIFQKNIKKDYKIYQEYHALLVEHAKRLKK